MKLEKGYVQIYTGDGKGKTTSALGLALRASGHGMKTAIIQFMKGDTSYGEVLAIEKIPEISLHQYGTLEFIREGGQREIDYEEAHAALEKAKQMMEDQEISILILDEINVALHFGLLELSRVLALIKSKPPHLELILTGRRVPKEIEAAADLVTRFIEEKHYYNTLGLQARMGIEF